MILTEKEARTKWCPEIRWIKNGMELTCNRPSPWRHENCIASNCMFWRWGNGGNAYRNEERVGYCGKGGKP